MLMKFKMIVTDVDDTLLRKDKTVSEYTLVYIIPGIDKRCHRKPTRKQHKIKPFYRATMNVF